MAQHPMLLFGNTHLGPAKRTWFNVPVFIDVMMENSNEIWGKPFYPLV
jgi:hypothetical protein